jgi:hypothetical protein
LDAAIVEAARVALWPAIDAHIRGSVPNRGPGRFFFPMPFEPPCFSTAFMFNPEVLAVVRIMLGERYVADQWGCDVCAEGSAHQGVHVDYRRPLFEELPDLRVPAYMIVVNFSLAPIGRADGIEIAPESHLLPREHAIAAVQADRIPLELVLLDPGDILIRHPWALHRGSPNVSGRPRPLVSIRYVRRWYSDGSREVSTVPAAVWNALTDEQRAVMRFPVATT